MAFAPNNPNNKQSTPAFSFGASTTPATGTNSTQQSNAPSLFGSKAQKPPNGSLFSGGTPITGTGTGIFGSTTPQSTPSGNAFASSNALNPAKPPTGGLFGQTAAPAPSTTGGFFGTKPPGGAATLSTPGLSGQTPGSMPNLFGKSTSAAAPSGNLFPPSNISGSTTPAGPAPTGGFFGSKPLETTIPTGAFGSKPAESSGQSGLFGTKPAETTPSAFSFASAAPASGAKDDKPVSTPSFLFGSSTATTTASKTDDKQTPAFSFAAPSAEKKEDKPASTGGPSISNVTTAEKKDNEPLNTTIPPAPAPPSLKNKSLDEIVTRWTNDLDKYSKEFQQLAKKVATWDQELVSNADKISNLYTQTVQAEQSQGKIDQSLGYIESQQAELSSILDVYESQVSQIFENADMNIGDSEREAAYKLAENLDSQLISIEKNLSGVIEEMNAARKEIKENDELAALMKILNNQLASLRWIEEAEEKLRSKLGAKIGEQ